MTDQEKELYKQVYEDWRHFDRTIWQLPSFSSALSVAFLGISYSPAITNDYLRSLLLLVGGILSLSLTVSLVKHRLFMNERSRVLNELEANWLTQSQVTTIPRRSTHSLKPKKRFQKISAFTWLKNTMFLLSWVFFVLCIFTFITKLTGM